MFSIDPDLLKASAPIRSLGLCDARLQNDRRFPWVVLIPRREGLRELEDLSVDERALLMNEIVAAGNAVRALGLASGSPVKKLNIGALGNLVPQLHIHVVGRRSDDPAWPGPVWGAGEPEPHAAADLTQRLAIASTVLAA